MTNSSTKYSNVNYCWVGPRLSDLKGIESFFSRAITIFGGSDINLENINLQEKGNILINHNAVDNIKIKNDFFSTYTIDILREYKNTKFIWYGRPSPEVISQEVIKNSLCLNSWDLCQIVNDKIFVRNIFSDQTTVLPGVPIKREDLSYKSLINIYPDHERFVIQNPTGAGGESTFIANNLDDLEFLKREYSLDSKLLVAPYFYNGIPINIHGIVFYDGVLVLSPSLQNIKNRNNNRLMFCGNTYDCENELLKKHHAYLETSMKTIGDYLRTRSYRGVFGVDYLIMNNKPYLIEINPRFQGSTVAQNKILLENDLPSVQSLHMKSFNNFEATPTLNIKKFRRTSVTYSYYIEGGGSCSKSSNFKIEDGALMNTDVSSI